MTFSIAAWCPRTGMLGVAVSSRSLACGAAVPYIKAGVGAIASQSLGNPFLGHDGLPLLEQGLSPEEVLERLLPDDPGRDVRQALIVDGRGRTAAFTGSMCIAWAGHRLGDIYVVGGNTLAGEQVIAAMAEAFEAGAKEELAERLMQALEAGQGAGGDRRGKQSAGILLMERNEHPYYDLRVDDHTEPVAELRRIFEMKKEQRRAYGGGHISRENLLPPGWQEWLAQLKAELEQRTGITKEH